MSIEVESWSPEERKKILRSRLNDARNSRKKKEEKWAQAEVNMVPILGMDAPQGISIPVQIQGADELEEIPEVGSNYLMKNIRFLQSQMSSNPPTCSPKPTSYDPADRDAADAAERVCRWALRNYEIHEEVDMRNLQTLTYGTGFTKKIWDYDAGEFLDDEEANAETNDAKFQMEGDFCLSVPNIWDMYLDADARNWKTVRFVFEKIRIPWTEAAAKWPTKLEELSKARRKNTSESPNNPNSNEELRSYHQKRTVYDVVELFEYWEKGLPSNGYVGRYTLITEDGSEIEELRINPEAYRPIGATRAELITAVKEDRVPQSRAVLPYDILTDLDDADSPWGESVVDYAGPLQEQLNRVDSALLQTADANGCARMTLHESSEIARDSITNSRYDIVKYSGTMPPDLMAPAPMSPVLSHLRQQLKADIDELMGVNESMFGQQSREQSGFSQTYSVNQGNMTRQRLFNKFVRNTERLYNRILLIAANKWKTKRIIQVIGDENNIETDAFRGADIAYGYDVRCEFSSALSLDPQTRRAELLQTQDLLKEAGVSPKKILDMMKMSELGNALDDGKLATNRMKTYFKRIERTSLQQKPRTKENHADMLEWAFTYVMTTAFDILPENIKVLIEEHITLREDLIKEKLAEEGQAGAPEAPGEEMALPPGPPVGLL